MKYRHGFHAGNFADVHKHVALVALIKAMQRKDSGFFYLDTHAGAGRYDLDDPKTHRGAEARHGVGVVLSAAAPFESEALRDYRSAVLAMRQELDDPSAYPGSPWLAAHALRTQDRGLCCESLPAECRALERALGGRRRMQVLCADGYTQIRAALPPRERRCVVLIDPPYEQPGQESARALEAIGAILERLANAVVLLWYAIKDERTLIAWLAQAERSIAAPSANLELWIYPRDSRVGLNGSGLLLINPPYRFTDEAESWQRELHGLLDPGRRGGCSVHGLRPGPVDDTGT